MNKLKELRKAIKRTQTDIATYLGVTVSAYGNYELGQREPDIKTLKNLADYFGVTVDYLLERDTDHCNDNLFAHISPELLAQLNALTPEQQEKVIVFIKGLLA